MRHMGFLLVLFAVVAIVVATLLTLEPGGNVRIPPRLNALRNVQNATNPGASLLRYAGGGAGGRVGAGLVVRS